MPIPTVFQSQDGFYTEVELRREGTTVLVAGYDLFGQIKLYRIEWNEEVGWSGHQAEHRLDLAVQCFNTHAPAPKVEVVRCHDCALMLNGDGTTPGDTEGGPYIIDNKVFCSYCIGKYTNPQDSDEAGITTYFLCGKHTDTNVECRQDDYYCPKCGGTPPSVTDYDTLYPHGW